MIIRDGEYTTERFEKRFCLIVVRSDEFCRGATKKILRTRLQCSQRMIVSSVSCSRVMRAYYNAGMNINRYARIGQAIMHLFLRRVTRRKSRLARAQMRSRVRSLCVQRQIERSRHVSMREHPRFPKRPARGREDVSRPEVSFGAEKVRSLEIAPIARSRSRHAMTQSPKSRRDPCRLAFDLLVRNCLCVTAREISLGGYLSASAAGD